MGSGRKRFVHHGQGFRSLGGGSRYGGQGRGTRAVKIELQGDALSAQGIWTNSENSVQFNTPVIKDGLLVTADLLGVVHCLDAKTGKVHWTYDLKSQIWGSPCLVEDKMYLGDQDGDVAVFQLSTKPNLLATNAMQAAVYSTPVAVDDVLYIATATHLIAVAKGK